MIRNGDPGLVSGAYRQSARVFLFLVRSRPNNHEKDGKVDTFHISFTKNYGNEATGTSATVVEQLPRRPGTACCGEYAALEGESAGDPLW